MNNIVTSLLSFLWILLVGTPTSDKSTILNRKPTRPDYQTLFYCWLERNFILFAYIAIIFLLIIFVIVCFWLCGISATESGNFYNHLGGVI